MAHLVLTLIGPDRPGIVEDVAGPVTAHGGNWVESRMARLGGQFAGILRVEVPDDRAQALVEALRLLERHGLRVAVEAETRAAPSTATRLLSVDLVGLDRPGIVREISHVFAERGVNIEELSTDLAPAAMSGEMLFRTRALVKVPPQLDIAELRARLEKLAADLMVSVSVAEPQQG